MSALFQTYTPFPFVMSHASGDMVYAEDGRAFYDFYGGHCVASTGHSHPQVSQAVSAQAAKLLFYSTAGDMRIRRQAAERLIDFAQGSGMKQVFFCNSGAEANENAIKIAHLLTGREKVLGIDGGWHGRTLGCLSVTTDEKLCAPMHSWLLPSSRLPLNDEQALAAFDFSPFACVVLEPVQSLSGIEVAKASWLKMLRERTKAAGCLLVFDEIQTGVGRVGTPFAAHYFDIRPDLITSAKGLASGVPIGAVLMSESVAGALKPSDLGSTFGGGPLACAALIATLDVIEHEQLMLWCQKQSQAIVHSLAALGLGMRGLGLLLGIESTQAARLKQHLFEAGILLGGSSKPSVLRLMPPLNISTAAVTALCTHTANFLAHTSVSEPTGARS